MLCTQPSIIYDREPFQDSQGSKVGSEPGRKAQMQACPVCVAQLERCFLPYGPKQALMLLYGCPVQM